MREQPRTGQQSEGGRKPEEYGAMETEGREHIKVEGTVDLAPTCAENASYAMTEKCPLDLVHGGALEDGGHDHLEPAGGALAK